MRQKQKVWKRFETNIIRLNKAETARERIHVIRKISIGKIGAGGEYKVKKLKNLVMH